MKRVRIFVDHQNFTIGWEKTPDVGKFDIAWKRLPDVVMRHLDAHGFIEKNNSEMRAIAVYASVDPRGGKEACEQEKFLKYELDQMPGYTVKTSLRQERQCKHDPSVIHWVEKGVDTKIVCDMLALAMRDLYDLGVIISNDSDLVPSIECVQDILDRQIVHLGFKRSGQEIRSAAWGHMALDKMKGELKGPQKSMPGGRPRTANQMESAFESAQGEGRARRRRSRRSKPKPAPIKAPSEISP